LSFANLTSKSWTIQEKEKEKEKEKEREKERERERERGLTEKFGAIKLGLSFTLWLTGAKTQEKKVFLKKKKKRDSEMVDQVRRKDGKVKSHFCSRTFTSLSPLSFLLGFASFFFLF
jgi:hypothetical protein